MIGSTACASIDCYHLGASPYPSAGVIRNALIVTKNSLPGILAVTNYSESMVASPTPNIQNISVASSVSLESCPHTLGGTSLVSSQLGWLENEISCYIHHLNIL